MLFVTASSQPAVASSSALAAGAPQGRNVEEDDMMDDDGPITYDALYAATQS